MKRLVNRDVWASEIAEYLGMKLKSDDFIIKKPSSPKYLEENTITYLSSNQINNLHCNINTVIVVTDKNGENRHPNIFQVENPQLKFYKIINEFFMDDIIAEKPVNAMISPDAKIGRSVSIGENSYIGRGCVIDSNSVIGRNVYIAPDTIIGKNCYIKENAVLGSEGYQFIETESGYMNKPCLGRIILHDNVLIGSGTTLEIPDFDITEIHNYVKIDDLVNIGSACIIEEKSLIAGGSVLCHQVQIGEKTQIGAGARIRERVVIGSNVTVGIGSVVISNLEDSCTYAGNPARKI